MFMMGKRSAWAAQSKLPESTMAPPIVVPWPPMYLVRECTAISAPWSKTRHSTGVATVLSTIKGTPALWAMSAHLLDVDDIARRVADGFAEQGLGVFVDQGGSGVEVIRRGKPHLDTLAREGVGEQVVGAAIQLGGTDDIAADLGDGLDRVADGGHTGAHRQCAHAALKFCQALFQHRIGGVHDAAVDIAGHRQVEQVGAVLGVVEGVGRGLVNRRGGRVGRGVARVTRVQGNGFRFHAGSRFIRSACGCGRDSRA